MRVLSVHLLINRQTLVSLLARGESKTTWHHVLSFNPTANNYLRNLTKGSHVFVEANYELREPEPNAEPDSPQGQRQIFLRHGKYRLFIFMVVDQAHIRNLESIRVLKSSNPQNAPQESE
jgi:hypothetical protein